ncbi:PQQ-binding-like beta-propeller repeat protein [Pseudomonas urmiensis]|uniref:PQQ-binding-like beta-propeller repeat protein n=1 Tax=Pseudomonas urmiensis TaxID=2745493 RepID=A0A923JU88_9PSED|nr:PQQ-binding-like beta-propeller repeat protein [Pseudomonas urmiensis]
MAERRLGNAQLGGCTGKAPLLCDRKESLDVAQVVTRHADTPTLRRRVTTRGGPITTASGLIVMAATQDNYLRALDTRTGRELWKSRLPVGAETVPMTYVSPSSGRQFVVISAGGNLSTTQKGDYVVAYALPK